MRYIKSFIQWMARPFPHINVVVLAIFASIIFLCGINIAWHPHITEFFTIMKAPKLGVVIRYGSLIFLSGYCTCGCFCRILIHFFPDELGQPAGKI